MNNKKDYYTILGVARNADAAEIKSSFRKMGKIYHPDANPDDPTAGAKMAEINEAYAVLSNPEKRAEYDRQGYSEPIQGRTRSEGDDIFGGGFNFNTNFDFNDVFDKAFGFSHIKKGGRRGRDITVTIQIGRDEAVSGTSKDVTFVSLEKCHSCGGTGAAAGSAIEVCSRCNGKGQVRTTVQSAFGKSTKTNICPACHGKGKEIKGQCQKCAGTGKEKQNRQATVRIPNGIRTGQTIKVNEMGESGEGGIRGDLIVKVMVKG